MKRFLLLIILSSFSFLILSAQSLTGKELLQKSVNYHDPNGNWDKLRITYLFGETRPDGSVRKTKVRLNNKRNRFQLFQEKDGHQIFREVKNGKCKQRLDGKGEFSEELAKKYRLDCEYTKMIYGYYSYLWGLTMKLNDAGTIIHDDIKTVDFQGREALSLKVTYDEKVGKDTWYFYFDPATYGLIGYRFYHDESKNDGEYITLEGEVLYKGMRIPKIRKWYYNKDDKYLGTDTLEGVRSR